MRLETLKYLYDIDRATGRLERFTSGKRFSDYKEDEMLRSAVERQFEIIGESLAQLARIDQDTAARITEYPRIIAFRNILIHGYADVDDRLVWDIIETKLATLRRELDVLQADE